MEPALDAIGRRLAGGDLAALEQCYRALGPLVLAYLRRSVPSADVEDVLQRVFYEVWRARDRFDPQRSLRGWVLGIAQKRAIDQLRRRRDVVVPLDSVREVAGEDGRQTAERMIWADEIRGALGQLPSPQRQVIEMAYFGGYTQTEIAAVLAVPLGTVKTRTARGLQRLAGLLEGSQG
jgi:RNA polymerase sigma-70 factor (ECF subfamily)